MRKSVLLAGAGVFVALLVGAWWLGRHQASTDAPPNLQAPAIRSTAAQPHIRQLDTGSNGGPLSAPPETLESVPRLSTPPALPPQDTPLMAMFDQLEERAEAGDARAACRLAIELQRCQLAQHLPSMPQMERVAATVDDPGRREALIERAADQAIELERAETVCAGIDAQLYQRTFDYQRQAAHALPQLRIWAALRPALDRANFINQLADWARYRATALSWLESAAAEGDIASIAILASAYSVQGNARALLQPQIRQPDPERFMVYASLLERAGIRLELLDVELDTLQRNLDPSQLGLLRAEVDRLATRLPPTGTASNELVRRLNGDEVIDPRKCE